MGTIRRGRSQREEIKRITDEYLQGIQYKLTTRDYQILETLSRFGIMNSKQLCVLTPGAGSLPAFHLLAKGQQRLNDRLRVLFDLGLIYKMSPLLAPGKGTSPQYVWLDRGGLRLLGIEREIRRTLPADTWHRTAIIDVYIHLRRSLDTHVDTDLFLLDVEPVQQSWPLVPDLVVLYRHKGFGYLYFIEVDSGEKKEKEELIKLESYRNWQLSATWLSEPWAKIMPQARFPYLIYLFHEGNRSWKRRQSSFTGHAEHLRLPFRSMSLVEFHNLVFPHESPEA